MPQITLVALIIFAAGAVLLFVGYSLDQLVTVHNLSIKGPNNAIQVTLRLIITSRVKRDRANYDTRIEALAREATVRYLLSHQEFDHASFSSELRRELRVIKDGSATVHLTSIDTPATRGDFVVLGE